MIYVYFVILSNVHPDQRAFKYIIIHTNCTQIRLACLLYVEFLNKYFSKKAQNKITET